MNHMTDVASYWVCACQRPLTSGTKALLVVNSFKLHLNASKQYMYTVCILTIRKLGAFKFPSRASYRPFGWIFDRKVWIFRPFCCKVWKQNNAIFWGKIALALEPFKTWIPPLSFYNTRNSKQQSQNPSKSLKKLLLRQKDDCHNIPLWVKVTQHLFNIDLYTYLVIGHYWWSKR